MNEKLITKNSFFSKDAFEMPEKNKLVFAHYCNSKETKINSSKNLKLFLNSKSSINKSQHLDSMVSFDKLRSQNTFYNSKNVFMRNKRAEETPKGHENSLKNEFIKKNLTNSIKYCTEYYEKNMTNMETELHPTLNTESNEN